MRRGHVGALGNPPHALAPLAREVIYLGQLVSIVQGRSDCAAWLEHSNPTARVLMNEEQRCCFPERDRGQRKGTRTGIHPGLYLDTCDQRQCDYRALFSSFTFNRFLGPSELLAAGEGVGVRLAL